MTQNFDPVASDIHEIDDANPPFINSFVLESHGAKLNAIFYGANGLGPHPTVILLPGYPGNEKNLDLAQSIRRAGVNIFFCHYRGTWGNGGLYTVENAIEDTHAFIDYLQALPLENKLRVDTSRIWLVGHSLGGFLALMVGSQRKEIGKIATIAPGNMAHIIPLLREDPELLQANSVVSPPFDQFAKHMFENPSAYDSFAVVGEFLEREVLIIGAGRDEAIPVELHLHPLIAAFQEHSTVAFEYLIFDDDHSFSAHRVALARSIIEWLLR